jgi:hypothetical protein
LGLQYAQPWWTLDAIFFEREHLGLADYLNVAIEHENYSRRAVYQINKLSIFNAPLKVLIIYPGRPSKRGEPEQEGLLRLCSETVRAADTLGDFSHTRRQMIVLGSDQSMPEMGLLAWRYFLYEHGSFVQLPI